MMNSCIFIWVKVVKSTMATYFQKSYISSSLQNSYCHPNNQFYYII